MADRGRIVIVEDDPGLNQAVLRLLQAAGFEAVGFDTATAALADQSARKTACLVVDVHLADMTGYEFLHRLSLAGPLPPVIIVTAHDNASSRRQAQSIGAAEYLTKPFPGRLLVDAVKRIVTESSAKS
ncbi:FixJ family two-component response regulator [Povalibacter uvarum]|uniref:FixJ family two-component response regulator n=1 Tax=Povalibacter uvarum TaxID=732238 RepID=A0A841HR73_9GAMM|nr:response regulator [Povalibacter uvarum]MBB6095263.1 FixJ family two-component response regulator [Povalibacter uvarum]